MTREWLVELLGLPADVSVGFVTGTQMAHVTGLAAARFHVLNAVGWDVGRDGLNGAPRVRVVVGAKRHVTVDRALRLLGLGSPTVVDADDQGRMRRDRLRAALAGEERPTIVCAQAGEVNTGAFDPLPEIADACEAAGAWLHVDGAFGIWAAVSPRLRGLVAAIDRADSWTTDAHKWLNVPYDSGIVFCAHPESHRAAMTVSAAYLIQDEGARRVRDQVDWVPEFSRRARGFAVYAALRSLGRSGVTAIVERCCDGAARFAERIVELPGVELLNEVVLNQVLFRFESDERTDAVLRRVQDGGRVWMSGTTWDGRKAIRLSVSNWQDVALEAPSEQGLEPLGHGDELSQVDAGLDPFALEQVDKVLGGDVPGRLRRIRTTPEAADGCVEQRRAGLERRVRVREAGVARVVEMETYVGAEDRDALDEALDLRRRGDADRVREDDLVRVERFAEVGDGGGVDAALEGAAEGDADGRGRRQLGLGEDRLSLLGRACS